MNAHASLKRKAPLRSKRKSKSAELRAFHDWVAQQGCLVCGGDATLHHVSGYADRMGRFTRSEWLVTPLCPFHHLIQHGGQMSVEGLGHRGFYQEYAVDLLEAAKGLRGRWEDMKDG